MCPYTIDHQTLLERLKQHFGMTGIPRAWMTSYLSEHFQTVSVEGELSLPVLMEYSVPQGSVLGPKIYGLYTKPLGDVIRRHGLQHHFYADDTQLYLSFKPKVRTFYIKTFTVHGQSVRTSRKCSNNINNMCA